MSGPVFSRPQGRRVAITGMGVVSAMGTALGDYRRNLRTCRSGIAPYVAAHHTWPRDQTGAPRRYVAAAVPHAADEAPDAERVAGLDPFARFAVHAAREALCDAGVEALQGFHERAALVLGTGVGGDHSRDAASYRVFARQQRPHPLTVVRAMSNAAVSAVSVAFQLRGPALAISSACASGTQAVGEAFRMVRFGLADYAVAGGSESLPAYSLYRSWQQMKVLSPDGCRPFAADRNGIVLGEGAGILVLEALDAAQARGAHVYAEVAGFGMCADACDWVNASPDGMWRCMSEAVADAALDPADLAYINAHATGTARGDAAEGAAIARLLGPARSRVPVSSTKALHGHALGASGALEAIATALALDGGWIPAMPGATPDPAIPLHLSWDDGTGEARTLEGAAALSNSFALGGLNAALVLRTVAPSV